MSPADIVWFAADMAGSHSGTILKLIILRRLSEIGKMFSEMHGLGFLSAFMRHGADMEPVNERGTLSSRQKCDEWWGYRQL